MRRFGNSIRACYQHPRAGQMSVELVVCIPVVLVVIGLAINVLVFLDTCSRFDHIAAEAVRVEAASPAYGSYGLEQRRGNVEQCIVGALGTTLGQGSQVTVSSASAAGGGGEAGAQAPGFSLNPRLETYTCSFTYRPPLFKGTIFGVSFPGLTHERSFTIDLYRPGVLL